MQKAIKQSILCVLDGDRIFDRRVRIIIEDLKILELVISDRCWLALNYEFGQRPRFSLELLLHTLDLVQVNVTIAPSPDEVPGLQVALLRNHAGEQRILSHVKNLPDRRIA